jgi:septin family protein
MKKLQTVVNLLPIIARADTLTETEKQRHRKLVLIFFVELVLSFKPFES